MTFISYAQNFEDVTLWRALRDVEEGFFIDVGAYDPDDDSVTRAFSDRGWRGINIEPLPENCRRFDTRRPHDINLMAAVGSEEAELPFFEVAGTGLSTFSSTFADRYTEDGFTVTRRVVGQTTLAKVCHTHAPQPFIS